MDSLQGYVELREQVFEQILPLLDSDEIPAEDRFELSLQAAQLRGTLDLYQKAFKAAQSLETSRKMSAFMDLLGDIDAEIQDMSPAPDNEQPAETSSAEPSDNNQNPDNQG